MTYEANRAQQIAGQERRANAAWRQRRLAPYVFIAPFYVTFAVFFLGPTLFAFYLGLSTWSGVGPIKFVGVDNYVALVRDEVFQIAVANTAWYMVASVFVLNAVALVLATVLNAPNVRLRDLFRTVYFTPYVTSAVVVGIMFGFIYNDTYGLLNHALRFLGLQPVNWLSIDNSKTSIILATIWHWSGYIMIYFLAGLQGISRELYEAAAVDGASALQRFRHVTIPMLRPVIVFVAVISLIGSAQTFELPYIVTRGGPAESSLSVVQYLYRKGFEFFDLGYAASIGFTLFAVIFTLSWLQMKVLGVFSGEA